MRIVAIKFASGERTAMLLDEHGLPISGPTLFVTVMLRNAGQAFNTIRSKLGDLKILFHWQQERGRDLEAEMRRGEVLSLADAISIRDFAALNLRFTNTYERDKVMNLVGSDLAPLRDHPSVSKQVQFNRITTIACYLEFLGHSIAAQGKNPTLSKEVDTMVQRLRAHRPRGKHFAQNEDLDALSPPTSLIEEFVRVGSVGHGENPFRPGVTQRRNELVFLILLETGIRRGELLSLRIDQMQLGDEPYLAVDRTQDDKHDTRTYQPVAKTKGRILPISINLAKAIHAYCMKDRATTPGANRHPYLFVVHRRSKTCGQPLSLTSLSSKVFGAMQNVRPEFASVHPHSFRHHANYVFSQLADRTQLSEARELDVRAYLNGHRSKRSGEVYNKRHVREASNKAIRDLQEKLIQTGRVHDDP